MGVLGEFERISVTQFEIPFAPCVDILSFLVLLKSFSSRRVSPLNSSRNFAPSPLRGDLLQLLPTVARGVFAVKSDSMGSRIQ